MNGGETFRSGRVRGERERERERVRLIDKVTDRVQNSCDQYQSTSNTEQVMRPIWKLLLLSVLTNGNPQHPPGPDSLHSYHKWLISGLCGNSHNCLCTVIEAKIIFVDLTD